MLSRERYDSTVRSFPFLARVDAAVAAEFRAAAGYVRHAAGRQLFLEGERARALPLLVAGSVRVYKTGATGREITLYRFGAGETCILSASSILNRQPLPAAAAVEERVEAALVPAATLRRWVHEHEAWRDFVFGLMAHRLTDLLGIVDTVAFRRMDARVAALLLERAQLRNPIRVTHQEIAAELGTSREVVSRILENLAGEGLVRVTRGRIEVLRQEPLAAFAAL